MKNNQKSTDKIVFVYNADSGFANALLDYGKKYVQPTKYDCRLCMVTYGVLGMKKDWKQFTKSLPLPVQFIHRDEFERNYPKVSLSYPVILQIKNGAPAVLVSSKDFDSIKSLQDLMTVVSGRLGSSHTIIQGRAS